MPVGPPFNVQFQATATLLAQDDPEITALLAVARVPLHTGPRSIPVAGAH